MRSGAPTPIASSTFLRAPFFGNDSVALYLDLLRAEGRPANARQRLAERH
jgi:hypothetical protein